jgi:hypothetical protein
VFQTEHRPASLSAVLLRKKMNMNSAVTLNLDIPTRLPPHALSSALRSVINSTPSWVSTLSLSQAHNKRKCTHNASQKKEKTQTAFFFSFL